MSTYEDSKAFNLKHFRPEFTLTERDFHFLSNWVEYDRAHSYPFEFETNEIPIDSKQNYPQDKIPFNFKGNKHSFFWVCIKTLK